jgi:phosphatidylserine decarboxylase
MEGEFLMTISRTIKDGIHFLLTNLPPRRTVSRWMGRLSRIQNPSWTRLALWVWQRFDRLELDDSPPCQYASVHDCFIRPLKPGARAIDPDPETLTSPCDGILGAFGRVQAGHLYQIKGQNYRIDELIGVGRDTHGWQNGHFMTIRIKSSMYHRFHAPAAGQLLNVQHFTGDAYNVTPATLRWIDRLFCKNERACLTYHLAPGDCIAMVPVAAILVAGIRLHALDGIDWLGDQRVTTPPKPASYVKGEELGWFEHGSTIVMLTPAHWEPLPSLRQGDRLWMGQALFRRGDASP